MNLPTIIAHGTVRRLRWFLWHPLRRGAWRWPRVERMGQFGRYQYRWRIGPLDGKYMNYTPEKGRDYL